jgi:hypothetical protein
MNPGKFFLILGAAFMVLGAILLLIGKTTGLGKLPGDIFIQKGNFSGSTRFARSPLCKSRTTLSEPQRGESKGIAVE